MLDTVSIIIGTSISKIIKGLDNRDVIDVSKFPGREYIEDIGPAADKLRISFGRNNPGFV